MSAKNEIAAVMNEHGIPKFPCGVAQFERVLLFRIPSKAETSETYEEGGKIIKAERRITTDTLGTPRCVIVSAGLRALDIMRANGMRIGDVVWIAPDVFTRYEAGYFGGRALEFAFCNLGDIITNESLAARLTMEDVDGNTEMSVAWDPQRKIHVIVENSTGLDMGHEQPRHRPDEI
jgi:hypothetical protein